MRILRQSTWFQGVLLAVVLLPLLGMFTYADDTRSIQAMLIRASNDPAPLDQRLDVIEYKLRRLFNFEHYRFMGDASAMVNLPGEATLSLGSGVRLEINAFHADGDRVRSQVKWMRNDQVLLSTTVVMTPNTPVVLGGVPDGNGTLIVTLIVK